MKIRSIIAALGVVAGFATHASASTNTIAYWRFENGTNGEERPQGLNYNPYEEFNQWYTDSSGNGNHLSTWGSSSRPTATNAVLFSLVPQTGTTNGLALDFDGSDGLGTFGAQTIRPGSGLHIEHFI